MSIFQRPIPAFLMISGFVIMTALGGGWLWLRGSLPKSDGEISVAGLSASVDITRDAMGLVKIKADNELDAAFALGFAHAQDRLWQMDFWRRTGSGRLSEVIGSATVSVDRFMRTLGLKRVAEENLARLSPEVVALLESYSDGVNAFMEQP